MRSLTRILVVVVLAGCAASYQQNVVAPMASKLERGKPVLIATPASGSYGNKQYPASGQQTATVVHGAFAKYTKAAVSNCLDLTCLLNEGRKDYSYYVVPQILHWEDRNTEWSGIPDRVEIKITVYDASGKDLAAIVLSGTSKWATFGGDHPEDLLPEPIGQYVTSLY